MPNESNIESPLIIIGAGRAGTSWLQVVLRNHPAVQRVIDNIKRIPDVYVVKRIIH